jgi:hemoglobin-like flavoprotein
MTPEQVTLIRTSWRQITPVAATAAGLFYERLFALDPALRPLFAHTDMERQGKKLLQALGVVVAAADRLHTLGPALEELGRAHLAYGVADRHCDTVGAALLATFESALGDAFTAPLREAWAQAYAGVASFMLAGAKRGRQAA